MTKLLAPIMVAFTIGLLPQASQADEARILLVASKPDHAFGCHMYEFECRLLSKCLEKNNGVRAEYVAAWPPTDEQLSSASAIVFYSNPAGSVLLTEPHRGRFDELMKRKVGFVAIHWSTGVGYDEVSDPQTHRDQFKGWLGGWFRRPPCDIKTGRADLRLLDRQHPIGRGWKEWNIHDEFYLNLVLHDEAEPLLEVEVDGKNHVVGWTYSREGKGRSAGITLGHFHSNFENDDFRRMLVNTILWSAQVPIPEKGSIVEIDADELKLPEQDPDRKRESAGWEGTPGAPRLAIGTFTTRTSAPSIPLIPRP